MLDEQHRQLAVVADPLDEAAELGDLLVVEPARRLVEQEQLGRGDEGAGELDALQCPKGRPDGPIRDRGQPDVVEHVARLRLRVAAANVGADEDVIEHGHRLEELDVLERPGDAAADDPVHRRLQQARRRGRLPVRRVEPGNDVEGGRLAAAVRPDQTHDLALRHIERDPSRATIPPNRRVTFRSESRAIGRRSLFGPAGPWQRNRGRPGRALLSAA